MAQLPTPGGDNNMWGAELNDFLLVSHNADGTLVGSGVVAGSYEAATVTVDASGRVTGATAGDYATVASLDAYAPVAEVRDLSVPSPAASRIDPNLAVARRVTSPLTIPTGYTGNDIVEPELLYDPDASLWGSRYLLIAAPYYQSNAALENPSLWVSNDGTTWTVPAGVTNPIYPSGVGGAGYGNNSDPSILLGNDGQLYMLFNEFFPSGNWGVRAASCPPSNLAGWDAAPTTVVSTAIGTSRSTSPSGFYDPALGEYVFYSIDIVPSPNVLQRWTSANPKTAWTLTTAPTFPTWPATGREMWHLNAYLIGDQHVLLISDTATGGSGPGNLYLAVSNDRGATWSIGQQPLIYGTGISGQWDQGLYRSAIFRSGAATNSPSTCSTGAIPTPTPGGSAGPPSRSPDTTRARR